MSVESHTTQADGISLKESKVMKMGAPHYWEIRYHKMPCCSFSSCSNLMAVSHYKVYPTAGSGVCRKHLLEAGEAVLPYHYIPIVLVYTHGQ